MGHLLLDILGRWRLLLYLVAIPYLPVTGWPLVVTALMIGTWFLSRQTSREILQLPLSRKQLWRTRWIFAFTIPLFHLFGRLARLGIAAADGREAAFSLSWALMIFVLQLSTLGILAVMSGPIRKRASKLLHPAKRFHDFFFLNVYPAGYVMVTLVAMAVAIVLEGPAYRQMAEWPAGVPLLLAVGLCAGAISFFHSPQIAPRSVVDLSPRESCFSKLRRLIWKGGNETPPLTKSWPTGPALFVWREVRAIVLSAMISGPLYIFLWWVLDTLLLKRFTMFSEGPHTLAAIFLLGGSIGSYNRTSSLGLRHLRVLPLSTHTLAATFTLLPVLSGLCSWVVPVAAYRMMSGHLPWAWALRLESLCVLAGLSCLRSSLAQSAVGTLLRFLPAALLFMAAGFGTYLYGKPSPPGATGLISLLGLAGVAASFVLNARALRSSSIYKPLPVPSVSQPRWISE